MKITNLTTYVMGSAWRNLVFIRLDTDEGIHGIGEASLTNRDDAVVGYLEGAKRRHVIGSDPFNVEDLWMRMYRNDFWRGGVIANTALSAVEIACWDIIGKATGRPVWQLLGGRCHEKLKAYANAWYTVERSPKEFAKRVKVVLAKGYKALKVDPFGPGAYELARKEKVLSIGILEALRDAVGPEVEIFVEGHGRFSTSTAAELAREMAPFKPGWFEEPVPPDNHDEMANAVERIGGLMPVAAGERCFTRYEARSLLERGNIDIAQFDVVHCGGLLELKKMAAMADARYVTVAPHNSQGPGCTAASVHADFTMTNFKIQEVFEDFVEPHISEAILGRPKVVDGYIGLPTKPGLGIELNMEVIKAHPRKDVFFNLWADDWQHRGFSGGGAKRTK